MSVTVIVDPQSAINVIKALTIRRDKLHVALEKAMDRALEPAVSEAQKQVSVQHGTLKRAIGKRVRSYHKEIVVGLVGVRSGFKADISEFVSFLSHVSPDYVYHLNTPMLRNIVEDPRRYVHLVYYGHHFGQVNIPGNPFLAVAYLSTKTHVEKTLGEVIFEALN